VFYLKYDIYRNAWPLLALATYRKIVRNANTSQINEVDGRPHPHLENTPAALPPANNGSPTASSSS
jgi:hypothetical protein